MEVNKSFSFLTIGKVQESTEAQEFKKYIGIGSFFVKAFNPTKEDLSKLYNREITKDQEYIGTIKDNDGKDVQAAHLIFICKSDPNYPSEAPCGVDEFFTARFTIQNRIRLNHDGNKCKVIDKFGRTAWVTQEELKEHATLLTKNDGSKYQSNIDKDYRPAFIGEEALVQFLINYLNIDSPMKYVNGSWIKNDGNPEDYMFNLDHIADYFKGDFSELKDILTLVPNNKFKAVVGVRTTDDGKQFSTMYTNFTMKNNSRSTSKLEATIQTAKNAGTLKSTEFNFTPLHEYTVVETNFGSGTDNSDALPFKAPVDDPFKA